MLSDIPSDSENLDQRRLAQLQKEYEEAEKAAGEEGGEGAGEGKTGNARPNFGKRGSFLNRLIQSGNKRTEDQLARMAEGNGEGEKR